VAIAAEAGGLKLLASFDRLHVEAGGVITGSLRIENTRVTHVVFEEPCNAPTMTVALRTPIDPVGRDWDGIEGTFKTYALTKSTGSPIESSIRTPLPTIAAMGPCHAANGPDVGGFPTRIIEAGATYETSFTWTAELVRGLPSDPGLAPFTISVRYDLESAGDGLIRGETLEATGSITVVAGAPGALSAGQALDAALADARFVAWLEERPDDAWENANLLLQPGAIGVKSLPEVPYWDVELYREPRSWAVLLIDAASGAVLRRTFCNIPCDR
jgi:hypothetical protein